MNEWWRTFFDADYLHLWEGSEPSEKTEREVSGLWQLLELQADSRVLDAPCGYGRIARGLALRGAVVLGIDFSTDLLAEAGRRRSDVPPARLRYLQHDLRTPIGECDFDVAINVFSSLGHGSEADDLAILSTLRAAVHPGGRVFVETMHRDRLAVLLSQAERHGS